MNPKEYQAALAADGFDPGPIDGLWGPQTQAASEAWFKSGKEIDDVPIVPEPPPPSGINPIPVEWLPACAMKRVHCHWSAGSYTASENDRDHYHLIVDGNIQLIRGKHSIADNVSTADGKYAAHTKNANTGAIGISAACMAGAIENPFNAGQYPLKIEQWEFLAACAAQLCRFYGIKVTPTTVLQHGEVQANLHIQQNGKWDCVKLPWAPELSPAAACDQWRQRVQWWIDLAG